jgi:hypothetical protein
VGERRLGEASLSLALLVLFPYALLMDPHAWRDEVARLLEHCASSLRVRNDRHAVTAFGTAIAYLHKERGEGQRLAGELLAQVAEVVGDGSTQRFTFTPGELDEIKSRPTDD